ncbi:MAG: 6-phosphofructokinase [Bacteroidia bacterium]|nr:6-phosphofructokinase [Bacteroidia bacterium]MCF8425351.1 6-phosphofructokinase [Bacteroidia bacterium]MCF8446866.1 6-phosphofructokinase [Bacteroidia bacterium]
MKKIGVFTSGGDSPGMNACVRAVVRTAISNDVEVVGIMQGYKGMIEGGDNFTALTSRSVGNIIQRGGTILKSSRSKAFMTPVGRKMAYENLVDQGIEGIVCIGGNGTFTGAEIFYNEYGIPSIGAPGTIDNDLYGTDLTIGFDTAINTAVDAIDKIRDTADSHGRVFFIEVMGRDAGFIALAATIAGGAEMVLLPEVKEEHTVLIDFFRSRNETKKSFSIVVVAEGNFEGGAQAISSMLNKEIPGFESRVVILGHIQRGGSPTAYDRVLASKLGYGAVNALLAGEKNKMVGLIDNKIRLTPFIDSITMKKDLNADMLKLIDILNN